MKATLVTEIAKNYQSMLGHSIRVNGWIRSVRDSKTFGFIELNDGSGFKNIQIVFDTNLHNFDDIVKFTTGSSVDVEGTLVASEGAKQAYEVKATKVTLLG